MTAGALASGGGLLLLFRVLVNVGSRFFFGGMVRGLLRGVLVVASRVPWVDLALFQDMSGWIGVFYRLMEG